MRNLPDILNREYFEFISKSDDWINIQEKKLRQILANNANCSFGKKYHFDKINTSLEFSKRVPVSRWEDIEIYMKDLAIGSPSQLCSSIVTHIVPTSGTTGANKRIPYTYEFLEEYRKGLMVWIADLYTHYPQMIDLKSFWSVSPKVDKNNNTCSDEFPDDLLYFGELAGWIAKQFAIGPEIMEEDDFDHFMELLVSSLVGNRELGFISVWHPTYLTGMIRFLKENKEKILSNILKGKVKLNGRAIQNSEKEAIRDVLMGGEEIPNLIQLWPKLQLISCWTEGEASSFIPGIRHYFPGIEIQAKGLLATEGIMTIPLIEAAGAVPAYYSHFFEFLDRNGEPVPAWELQTGDYYSILLTTSAGLYRYRIGDRVKVTGWFGKLPILSFSGRDNTIDLCGEKLSYDFIMKSLAKLFAKYGFDPEFFLLSPAEENLPLHYLLFLDVPEEIPSLMALEFDNILRESFYYDHARRVGQLQIPEIIGVIKGAEKYRRACLRKGQILGNIKYSHIDKKRDWRRALA